MKRRLALSGAILAVAVFGFGIWRRWIHEPDTLEPIARKAPSPEEIRALIDDPECAFQKRLLNPDPRKLVEEYLLHDFRGEYLGSKTAQRLDDEMLCPNHVSGFDVARLVRSYRTVAADMGSEVAIFKVEYNVAGKTWGAQEQRENYLAFQPEGPFLSEEFRTISTPFGCRVDEAHPWKVGILHMLGWQADPRNAHFRPHDLVYNRGLLERIAQRSAWNRQRVGSDSQIL